MHPCLTPSSAPARQSVAPSNTHCRGLHRPLPTSSGHVNDGGLQGLLTEITMLHANLTVATLKAQYPYMHNFDLICSRYSSFILIKGDSGL